MIQVVSCRKADFAIIVMQKSHQNIQHGHAQTEQLVKYVRESIHQDYMVTRQRTRNLKIRLMLTMKMKLQ